MPESNKDLIYKTWIPDLRCALSGMTNQYEVS